MAFVLWCVSSDNGFCLLLSCSWKCLSYWPEDGRLYVALGKIMSKQSKTSQAKEIYEKGCQATQGENAFIWQVSVQFCFCM